MRVDRKKIYTIHKKSYKKKLTSREVMYDNGVHYTMVNLKDLFSDRDWDQDRDRRIDQYTRIYPQQFFSRAWIYCNTLSRSDWRTNCNVTAKQVTMFMFKKMIEEIIDKQHKMLIPVIGVNQKLRCTILVGVFEKLTISYQRYAIFRAFVGNKKSREVFSYRIPHVGVNWEIYRRVLDNVKKGVTYESIDVQERSHAYIGLDKTRRCSRRGTKVEEVDISGSHHEL